MKRLKIIFLWIQIRLSSFFKFIDRLEEHHVFLMAAGIAFNIFLYLIPLFLVSVYLVNLIFGADNITHILIKYIDSVLPPNTSTNKLLEDILTEVNLIFAHSSIVGWVGIAVLIWLSSTLLSAIRTGLNRIFEIETPRVFVFYKIKDIVLILLLMLMMIISSYIVPLYSIIYNLVIEHISPPYDWYFSRLFMTAATMLTSGIMFFGIFKFLPNDKMPRFIVGISTFLCVIAVELSRNIFAWYIVKFGTYGKFYGTYAVIVSVAVWIYYLTLIILFSAEISKFLYNKRAEKRRTKIIKKLENTLDAQD
jgi:membrane protein